MRFEHFLQPLTPEEALELAKKPDSIVLGGTMWCRMQKRKFENAIDLSLLDLNQIEEKEDGLYIGAYVTLRQAETSPLLQDYTKGAVEVALTPIVGVQFRNSATIGGSIVGRFGFSDVATLFTALGAKVKLVGKGVLPMEQYIKEGAPHDVLTHIILPKEKPDFVMTQAHRNSATDFPVVTMTICQRENSLRVTVSPAPIRGTTLDFIGQNPDQMQAVFLEKLSFSGDKTASKEYRQHLAQVFFKRALEKIGG